LAAILVIGSMLLSLTGLDIGIHSCGGEIHSWAIFSEPEVCEHAKQLVEESPGACCAESKKHCTASTRVKKPKKKKCCNDEELKLEVLDLEMLNDFGPEMELSLCPTLALSSPIALKFPTHTPDFIEYRRYKPPLPKKKLNLQFQVFLI